MIGKIVLWMISEACLLALLCNGVSGYERCEIKMRIYDSCSSKTFEEYCVEDGIKVFSSPLYNKSNCNTLLVGLPFQSNSSGAFILPTIEALTSRCAFNIILLDNSNHTNTPLLLQYGELVKHTYEDSKRYSEVINAAISGGMLSASCIKGVGFSMAAQLLGQVCRQLTAKNATNKCCSIHGFDPAGPLYFPAGLLILPQFQLVSKTDACNVVLFHCNMRTLGLGTSYLSGHYDIIVNNGSLQPNCIRNPNLCSHLVCNSLLANITRYPGKYQGFSSNSNANNSSYNISVPAIEGCNCQNTEQKKLYLSTLSQDAS